MTNGAALNLAGSQGDMTMIEVLVVGGVDMSLGAPLHEAALTPGRNEMMEHLGRIRRRWSCTDFEANGREKLFCFTRMSCRAKAVHAVDALLAQYE